MKTLIVTFLILIQSIAIAQFDIEQYKEYLKTHKDMTFDELIKEFPAGYFLKEAPTNLDEAEYGDSISIKYKLTNYEKELISKHGFMVTERLTYPTFHHAFKDIFYQDMPVYISSDAILHALHYSFDKILESIENKLLISALNSVLIKIQNQIKNLSEQSTDSLYQLAVNDFDIYITIARYLFIDAVKKSHVQPVFPENVYKISEILKLISQKNRVNIALFSNTERPYDFSQFEIRGHYTKSKNLSAYFQTMMWLGRTEIYITSPKHQGTFPEQTEDDIKRQNILSALIAEAATESGADTELKNIENLLEVLLGRQDNITIFEASDILKNLGNKDSKWVVEEENWKIFQSELLKLSSSNQLYSSQILASDPGNPEQINPPVAMMLVGQRAILDGYITANVVYDQIIFNGNKVTRMMPSTMDILFALGNDASIQLLEPEIRTYPYSSNLAALRYLVSSYDSTFWQSTCYTNWLSAIRALNPPANRESMPKFMQTAAWWQKSMNTQLASWSQLRHDFLLSAKQPYSDFLLCSYPDCFVEPVPELYKSIQGFINKLDGRIKSYTNGKFNDYNYNQVITAFRQVCDRLLVISQKEIQGISLDSNDLKFANSLLRPPDPKEDCVPTWGGWYFDLFYAIKRQNLQHNNNELPDIETDYTVADVHTIPTDADGNERGWVLHGGTGKINMAVLVNTRPDGKQCSYIGPVMSYYETVTTNYRRLTDQEWATYHSSGNSHRPALTNLYLADENGWSRSNKVSLYTLTTDIKDEESISKIYLSNYPNPFNDYTYIHFTVPPDFTNKLVNLNIYDLEGNLIKQLINKNLPASNYSYKWDGTNLLGNKVNSGVYVYRLIIGEMQETGKMILIDND